MSARHRGDRGASRARLLAGAGALAVVAALLPALDRAVGPDEDPGSTGALPLLTATDASWLDREHVASSLVRGARDCTRAYRYSSSSSSRMLSGTLLGASLDPVASVAGVTTRHTGEVGTSSTPQPSTAPSVGGDAHAAPLSVTALSSALGAQTASVVVLPAAGQETSVLQQHARAASDGEAAATTGAVTERGAVRTTSGTGSVPRGDLPSPARIDLARLAPGTATLAGLQLQVGALASTAMLDGCERDENGAVAVRDYGIAGLRTVLTTPAVPAVVQTAKGAVTTAQAAVDPLEKTLAGTLGLLGPVATVDIQVDLQPLLTGLVSQKLGAGSEVVVDLSTGTVEVDLARLLSGRGGVNGRAPGTELVLDQELQQLVAGRVTALLDAWAVSVEAAVKTALLSAPVQVRVLTLLGGSLLSLDTTVQGLLGSGDLGLATLISTLSSGLLGTPNGVVPKLGATVRVATPSVTTATSTALSGLRSAFSLVVNDQRQAGGVFDVAALRVRVLPGASTSPTDLRLATSSVGPVVERP